MSKTAVVLEEDNFGMYRRRIKSGYSEEVRRAAHAVEGRAKQLIIAWGAILTGDLYHSTGSKVDRGGQSAEVFSTMPYAKYVHDGTRKMRPRPYLTQAVKDITPEVQARLDEMLRTRWKR